MEARDLVASALLAVLRRTAAALLFAFFAVALTLPGAAKAAPPAPSATAGWWEFLWVLPDGYAEAPRPQSDIDEPGTFLFMRCVQLQDGGLSGCSPASWWPDFVYDPAWWEQSGWACVPGYPDDCGSAEVFVWACDVWAASCDATISGGPDPDPEPEPDPEASAALLAAAEAAASAAALAADQAGEVKRGLLAVLGLAFAGLGFFAYSVGRGDA